MIGAGASVGAAPGAPDRRAGGVAWGAAVAAAAVATVAVVVFASRSPAAAAAPVLALAAAWALWRAPLRTSAAALVLALLALDHSTDAQGAFHTPLVALGDLLRHNLDKIFVGSKLKLSGMEVVLLVLLAVGIRRQASGDRTDARGRTETARVARDVVALYLAALALATAWGLARGGSIDHAIVQVRPLLHVPLLFWLFQTAFHGRGDRVLVARIVVAAACVKAVLAIWADRAVGRTWPGPGKWACATNHGDSILFALACVVLLVALFERPDRKRLVRCLVFLPLLLGGMAANHRRLAWVDLAMALLAIYLVSPWNAWKRAATRTTLLVGPVLLLYVGAGWHSSAAVFAPIKMLRTVSDGNVDRSTLYRDVENWNLAKSIEEVPVLGTGFGHEYTIFLQGDDISSIFELYRVEPHNSVLGLILFAGTVGFAAMWLLFAVTIFLAVRSYRLASVPEDRAAALACLATVVVLMMQAWGDLGQFFTQFPVFAGLALAVASKLAVETGAWPAHRSVR